MRVTSGGSMALLLRKSSRAASTAAALLLLATAIAPRAGAVLIGPGDGTQNTTTPLGVPGWQNIGKISLGAGIYIGNQWAITAHHLDPTTNHTITFYPADTYPLGGVSFNIDNVVRLTNP